MDYEREFVELLDSLAADGRLKFARSSSLRNCSTFKIGGAADFTLCPSDEDTLTALISAADRYGVRYDVIGNGSNVLFADEGYRGALIFTGGLKKLETCGKLLTAQAGASLTLAAVTASRASLSGLEFAYGIPGSVGGAVFMNAGAYGGEMSQVVRSTRYYDCADGKIKTLDAVSHEFGYRKSFFNLSGSKNVILSSQLALAYGDAAQIKEQMEQYMTSRAENQPLEYPNAGSVFKRSPGHYTGRLIEDAGLKGKMVGGAQISEKHAGFIVNRGGASAADVLALIDIIKERVFALYGVELECEIRYIK